MPGALQQPDLDSFRQAMQQAVDLNQQLMQRIQAIPPGSGLAQQQMAATKSDVQLELDTAKITLTRLQAAGVTVQPVSAADAQQLGNLAAAIDQAIRTDAATNATIATVNDLLSKTQDIRGIIENATA